MNPCIGQTHQVTSSELQFFVKFYGLLEPARERLGPSLVSIGEPHAGSEVRYTSRETTIFK